MTRIALEVRGSKTMLVTTVPGGAGRGSGVRPGDEVAVTWEGAAAHAVAE